MNDKEKMLEFAKQTYREMVKQIDEMIPDEEQEMKPSYAIKILNKRLERLEKDIDNWKISHTSCNTVYFHELVEEYRATKYAIEYLGWYAKYEL